MRSHKPPKESLTSLFKRHSNPKTFQMLKNGSENSLHETIIETFTSMKSMGYEVARASYQSAVKVSVLKSYFKRRPNDIVLDKSILDLINKSTFDDLIELPDLNNGLVFVNIADFGFKITTQNNELDLDGDKTYLVAGITISQDLEYIKENIDPIFEEVITDKQKEASTIVIFHLIGEDILTDRALTVSISDTTLSFSKYQEDYLNTRSEPFAFTVLYVMIALKMIREGEFAKKTSLYEDRSKPINKKKAKKKVRKGLKFKQKYREYKTTYYSHVSTVQDQVKRNYTPPEHYTPRNIPSHYKERWVTLDYVEKNNVSDDDILDIEDRTKLYKKGEATKAWVKIKLWFEFTQDPNLEPTQETERYRV